MSDPYDFSGIATAYEVKCSDGRFIEDGAFAHQIGETIPMVWRHAHTKDTGDSTTWITNILGHGVLMDSRDPRGMRINAWFNKSKEGQQAKVLVHNEDIKYLSVWANELDEMSHAGPDGLRRVKKGTIREFSLVLNGANPGAKIDDVIRHSNDPFDMDHVVIDGIIVHGDYPIDSLQPEESVEEEDENLTHEEDTDNVRDVMESLTPEQKNLFDIILHSSIEGEKPAASKPTGDNGAGKTLKDIYDSLTEKQTDVLHYLAGAFAHEESNLSQELQGDANDMATTHNIFDQDNAQKGENGVISHEGLNNVLLLAKQDRVESLRKFMRDTDQAEFLSHSITDIDNLFPDAKNVKSGGPQFYSRPMEWVEKVLGGCNTRPFSRIKSQYADLTGADARAKGYVTGAQKVEEVIAVLKRVTLPQTIYKLQKLDRDDVIDITDFNVVVWLKSEMRLMLREELARAVLISDGRANTGADAIQTDNVRPIYNDNSVYTINATYDRVGDLEPLANYTNAELIVLIDYISEQMQHYLGSGSPTFYCQQALLTKFMGIRDTLGHRIHPNRAALADALDVADILPIPVMAGMQDDDVVDPPGLPAGTYDIATLGIIVNLRDYVIGADKGGQTTFFEDFDLNYNKHEYLYETRVSGALIEPKSAICIQMTTAKTA